MSDLELGSAWRLDFTVVLCWRVGSVKAGCKLPAGEAKQDSDVPAPNIPKAVVTIALYWAGPKPTLVQEREG